MSSGLNEFGTCTVSVRELVEDSLLEIREPYTVDYSHKKIRLQNPVRHNQTEDPTISLSSITVSTPSTYGSALWGHFWDLWFRTHS